MFEVSGEAQSFEAIKAWANDAKALILADPAKYSIPPLGPFKDHLTGGVFFAATIGELDIERRELICLSVNGPETSDEAVDRFMLPAHAALARCLELAGAKIELIRGSGGAIEKYYFNIAINGFRTNLHRVLFGLSSTGRLWERKHPQIYRYIVPATYKLGPGVSRGRLLAEISARFEGQSEEGNIPEPEGFLSTLTTLFAIADHWHWDELEGRSISNDKERFSVRSL
jgi:hypothetical protein